MTLPIDQQITFLYVRDLPVSAAFYSETLGLPLALDQGTCRIFRLTEHAFLGVCQRPEAGPPHNDLIVTLVTPAVEEWYARLAAAGAALEGPVAYHPAYEITHFFVRDPDGYRLEIQRFEHPFP